MIQMPVGLEEGILHSVLCKGCILQVQRAHSQKAGAVLVHQPLKGGAVFQSVSQGSHSFHIIRRRQNRKLHFEEKWI